MKYSVNAYYDGRQVSTFDHFGEDRKAAEILAHKLVDEPDFERSFDVANIVEKSEEGSKCIASLSRTDDGVVLLGERDEIQDADTAAKIRVIVPTEYTVTIGSDSWQITPDEREKLVEVLKGWSNEDGKADPIDTLDPERG